MPTYDYECEACGHRFEQFQSMSDKPMRTCPECRKRKLRRLIGAGAGLIFKGSGFYITDYRSDSYKKGAKKENGGSSGSASSEGSGSSGDSKPASKSSDG